MSSPYPAVPFPTLPSGLPELDADSASHSQRMDDFLSAHIKSKGPVSFEEWMDLALYAPGLGYYVSGSTKFGSGLPTGDFTTAPELTPLFGYTVARQVAQILQACDEPQVLEFGAGSGALAAAMLTALNEIGLKARYYILELSPELQARQKQCLHQFGDQVCWLSALPEQFSGCVIANEVLDAMPVRLFRWADEDELYELYVDAAAQGFNWLARPADLKLREIVARRMPALPGYQSELNLQAEAWVRQMGGWLKQGAALLIDYGFPQREYYHPQRAEGTLMCHFRHHAHAQPLILPGLQDITAHVDFTAMADAALAGGLRVLGYTSQAQFLMNAGLADLLGQHAGEPQILSAVQKLMSEAEMGELFKVMAIGTDLDVDYPLLGFTSRDRRNSL